MSVPAWKRRYSDMEFINSAHNLVLLCNSLAIKMPNKYKPMFWDMAHIATDAFRHVIIANSVYMSDISIENDFLYKHNNLMEAKGDIHALIALIEAAFDTCETNLTSEKWQKYMMRMRKDAGVLSHNALNPLKGVIESNRKKFVGRIDKLLQDDKKRERYEYERSIRDSQIEANHEQNLMKDYRYYDSINNYPCPTQNIMNNPLVPPAMGTMYSEQIQRLAAPVEMCVIVDKSDNRYRR